MTKTSTLTVCVLFIGSILLQSCATIISGSRQAMFVSGQPEGSTYYVGTKPLKASPVADKPGTVKVLIKRKGTSEFKIKHEGYKDYNEALNADRPNAVTYLNYLGLPLILPYLVGMMTDAGTGAVYKFSQTDIHAEMPHLTQAVAGAPSIQAGAMNVRIKGGDKMGNFYIVKEATDVLYFGKSLDVDAEHLRSNVNNTLKDLGYSVPGSEGRSMFSNGANSRYTIQGEMRDIKYDVKASNKYESFAHYSTHCRVEVTWKLVNQARQTVVEQKTSGMSIKGEKGGSAAFEDAFDNAFLTFLENKDVVAALSKPAAKAGAATEQLAAVMLRRAAPPKLTADNGVSLAARNVVVIETGDGHGSGCIVSTDGYIITNAHVVSDEQEVKVLLPDGLAAKGQVVRVNADLDLALVKIDAEGLSAFQLPTANQAEVGTDVFAIGTPADKELSQTVTKGIISARRKIEGRALIQTDVSINGGNSGGALVTRSGQLLGIVNAKIVGKGIEGIGFAIPAEQIADILQLKYID
ncbi:trypsin-like serine protease [Hymenobacter aquaticus]|uniref:Trypsin-like serine protease n=1 Tax=Hymenobacter aquaticus TaxID=1867101 RepID=A0A4Z0Q6S4_9BACT|nr:trypsin-like peptidase domain-containing protein [Hymenobacter aquaticus]TGE25787.1 trypsin-like serine protease [Hymenobacter aquaticus]